MKAWNLALVAGHVRDEHGTKVTMRGTRLEMRGTRPDMRGVRLALRGTHCTLSRSCHACHAHFPVPHHRRSDTPKL
ncbi:hypothetical protein B0H34DRAFT_489861 [Crassisporium funariophilum]|nr:hypothetical protein B0H34DRAFT_489861 [Crassisporium funariophilum]